ncbi:MAG TPA: DUF4168 domain-containing protein [Candidatus Binatia bacterium]|nr:DUF4168 domain-containing protein [Candidatus Binatia bacterium]
MKFAKTILPTMAMAVVALGLPVEAAWSAAAAPSPAAERTKVGDQDLRAFAKAYVQYHKLRQDYEAKIASTKDEAEKARLQREGDEKVKQALQKQGLTPQSYNRLFVAVNNDPQLRQKALGLISEERSKS